MRSIEVAGSSDVRTNSFFETVRKLKRSDSAAQICPSCGSTKIRFQDSLSGWLTPPVYSCEECGYAGRLVLELEKSELDKYTV